MTRAPSVNQIRFFSSVAFENAPKFMLAASCSAADAMMSHPWPRCGPYRRTGGTAPRSPARSGRRGLAVALGFGGAVDDDRTARGFDRRHRGTRCAGYLDRDRGRQLAL